MNPRLLLLHARARRVPAVLAGLAVTSLAAWLLAAQLAHAHGRTDPSARLPVAVLAPLVAAALVSSALEGPDEELEVSTRSRWAGLRLLLLVGLTITAAALLAVTGLWRPGAFGTHALVRNTLGEAGLVALAAAAISARLAWLPAFGHTLIAFSARPPNPGAAGSVWAWPVLPTGVGASLAVAAGLIVLGALAYAGAGARRHPGRRRGVA